MITQLDAVNAYRLLFGLKSKSDSVVSYYASAANALSEWRGGVYQFSGILPDDFCATVTAFIDLAM